MNHLNICKKLLFNIINNISTKKKKTFKIFLIFSLIYIKFYYQLRTIVVKGAKSKIHEKSNKQVRSGSVKEMTEFNVNENICR